MHTVNVRCNLCNADDYTVMYASNVADIPPTVKDYKSTVNKYGFFNRLVSCNRCGLIYMNPRDANVKSLYREVVDFAYLESWNDRVVTFRQHLKILNKYKKEKIGEKLLDVGCYAGIFINEAKTEGYDVTGIEPSKWAAEFARERTCTEVLQGSWDEVFLPVNHFNVITIWDVVEHLEDPASCFKRVYDWLIEDGIVAVTTHDIKGWFARVMGRKYPWLMRFHFYHFEPKTLAGILSKSGLTPISVKYYIKTVSLKYLLNRIGIKVRGRLFEKINFSFNTGDMFMIIARKSSQQSGKASIV